jgi:hypothetical protein
MHPEQIREILKEQDEDFKKLINMIQSILVGIDDQFPGRLSVRFLILNELKGNIELREKRICNL